MSISEWTSGIPIRYQNNSYLDLLKNTFRRRYWKVSGNGKKFKYLFGPYAQVLKSPLSKYQETKYQVVSSSELTFHKYFFYLW